MKSKKTTKSKQALAEKSPQEILAGFFHPDDTAMIEQYKRDLLNNLKKSASDTPPHLRNKLKKTSICIGEIAVIDEPNYEIIKANQNAQVIILKSLKDEWHLIDDFTFEDRTQKSRLTDSDMPPEETTWAVINFYPNKLLTSYKLKVKEVSRKRYITKDGEEFYYKGKRIKFDNKTTIYYKLVDILYGQSGESGFYSYEEINNELEIRGEDKLTSQDKIRKRINNAIDNLARFTHNTFPKIINQIKVINPQRGRGIEFNNPELSTN